jgi:hypothetical protein
MKRPITPSVDMFRRAVIVAVLACASAPAGELLLGTPRSAETLVSVPVILRTDTGTGVAGLDFTFSHDPDVFDLVGVTAGPATRDARKELTTRSEQPGEVRVVLTGVNREILANGTVATVELRRKTVQSGESLLEITDTTFTSIDARELPSQGDSATLRWENGDLRPDPAAPLPGEPSAGDGDGEPAPIPAGEVALVDPVATGEQPPGTPTQAGKKADGTRQIESALGRASELRGALEDPGMVAAGPGETPQTDLSDLPDTAPVPSPNALRKDLAAERTATGFAEPPAVAGERHEAPAEAPADTALRSRKRGALAALALAAGVILIALCYRLRGWLRS